MTEFHESGSDSEAARRQELATQFLTERQAFLLHRVRETFSAAATAANRADAAGGSVETQAAWEQANARYQAANAEMTAFQETYGQRPQQVSEGDRTAIDPLVAEVRELATAYINRTYPASLTGGEESEYYTNARQGMMAWAGLAEANGVPTRYGLSLAMVELAERTDPLQQQAAAETVQ